ncbi:MAG TPA: tetratricopeptide repeat protein [Kofleriaceae bacterium]|jgi:tetratricopeptide (TPR) repeat protein|nr:tetratricopeptide repeat protein [Kofleriaceae bacterium]
MHELIERLESLFAAGDLRAAAELIDADAGDPVRHAVGLAALAAHDSNAAACDQHARHALALRPYDPTVLHYMAVAALMRGDRPAAEHHAQAAVEHGGGVRSLGWLGNLQLGAGNAQAAEATYRRMLELAPDNPQALNGLGACRYKQRDLDGAVTCFAHAFDHDPTDPGPIRSMMNMYGEAGRVLGAIALAGLTRDHHDDEASSLALDLMVLHLNHVLMGGYPPPNAVPDADAAVSAVLRSSAGRPVRVRLGVARALIDCQRHDDARRLLAELDAQGEPEAAADRGNAAYVRGLIAQHDGDRQRALAAYEAAITADAKRWDACCNAVTLLLGRGDPESMAHAGKLLARIPPDVKGAAPQLLFNEAVHLHRTGRSAEARVDLQRVLAATKGEGELATLAGQLLEEVSRG